MYNKDIDVEKFITNIYDLIMQIDKENWLEIIKYSQLPNYEYIVLPDLFHVYDLKDNRIVHTDSGIIRNDLNEINDQCYNINSKYGNSQRSNNCFLPNILNDFQKLRDLKTIRDSKILIHPLKGLGYLYRLHMLELLNK